MSMNLKKQMFCAFLAFQGFLPLHPVSAQQPEGSRYYYSCANGTKFDIIISRGWDDHSATIRVNGRPAEKLNYMRGGAENVYGNSHYVWDEAASGTYFLDKSNGNTKPTLCQAYDPSKRAP